jgi:hypothetical protein
MKYFVKTAHGISTEFYRVLHDYPLYGTGQGSGASPSVWLSLVIVLLNSLTILALLAMSFVDPWEDIFEERNADLLWMIRLMDLMMVIRRRQCHTRN